MPLGLIGQGSRIASCTKKLSSGGPSGEVSRLCAIAAAEQSGALGVGLESDHVGGWMKTWMMYVVVDCPVDRAGGLQGRCGFEIV